MSGASPPLAFGCEMRSGYAFSRPCKQSFHPVLTHQFQVRWPWPRRATLSSSVPAAAFTASTPAYPDTTASVAAAEEEAPPPSPPPLHDAGAMSGESAPSLRWRDDRSWSRPTFVLDLSSDPFCGALETRRIGLLLSPGYRVLLPIVALTGPETLPDDAGTLFWRMAFRPPPGSPAAPPPFCAELVVGEVRGVEAAVTRQPGATSSLSAAAVDHADGAVGTGTAATNIAGSAAQGPHSSPPVPPVQRFFFYSTPFRVRWLSQLQGCIVVSLPCEERVVTLHAPHTPPQSVSAADEGGGAAPDVGSVGMGVPLAPAHSFAFPRGVVPLEVAEVFDRPFLAVGTYEHGVLICSLNMETAAVRSIARSIQLDRCRSSLFPVTHLAALFPAWQGRTERKKESRSRSSTAAAAAVAALESLNDGVLLCSSPYEPAATLLKLRGDVVETPSPGRSVETLLDVSPTVQPDVGPMVCSADRRVLRLRVLETEAEAAEKMATLRARRNDDGLAERTSPVVLVERTARLHYPLLRLMASPPVLQSFAGNYKGKDTYVKHWLFGVDNRNCVMLMDRTFARYVFQSHFQLHRCSDGELAAMRAGGVGAGVKSLKKDTEGGEETAAEEPPLLRVKLETKDEDEDAEKEKEGDGDSKGVSAAPKKKIMRAQGRLMGESKGEDGASAAMASGLLSLLASVPLEDACSGVAVVLAKNGEIQVAAAHDRHYVSLLTWRQGPPPPSPPPSSFYSAAVQDGGTDVSAVAIKEEV